MKKKLVLSFFISPPSFFLFFSCSQHMDTFNIPPKVLESFLLTATDKANTRKAIRLIEDTNRIMHKNGGNTDATTFAISEKYSDKELENLRKIVEEFQDWLEKQKA
jgi:hypothetical protein